MTEPPDERGHRVGTRGECDADTRGLSPAYPRFCVQGAERTIADAGHDGRQSIRDAPNSRNPMQEPLRLTLAGPAHARRTTSPASPALRHPRRSETARVIGLALRLMTYLCARAASSLSGDFRMLVIKPRLR